eukprot:1587157-Amphidinium_carterae.1
MEEEEKAKSKKELGLAVMLDGTDNSAWITEIRPGGAVDMFNRTFPDRRIEVDDRIVEVHGKAVSGMNPVEIIDLIHKSEVLRMRVARAVHPCLPLRVDMRRRGILCPR